MKIHKHCLIEKMRHYEDLLYNYVSESNALMKILGKGSGMHAYHVIRRIK